MSNVHFTISKPYKEEEPPKKLATEGSLSINLSNLHRVAQQVQVNPPLGVAFHCTQNPPTARKCWAEKKRPVMMEELNPM